MKKFEYKYVIIWGGIKRITRILNDYGILGWELVHAQGYRHYFKRSID